MSTLLVILSLPAWAQQETDELLLESGTFTVGEGAGTAPDVYVVRAGDTLWEISSAFLGNPYYWPRLWSINEQITNPHWIYPGNRIVFRPGTLLDPPELELEGRRSGRDGYITRTWDYGEVDTTCGADVRFSKSYPSDVFHAEGFLADPDDVQVYGRVEAARSQGKILGERDLLYLDLDDPEAFDCGDLVLVFRPARRERVGQYNAGKIKDREVYRTIGEARIVHRDGDRVAAVVRTSWSEIERGDLIGPMFPVAVELQVSEPQGDLEGQIVARLSEDSNMGTIGDTVFVNRGRADGVRVGDTFYVVERRDESVSLFHQDAELPETVVGRVVAVRVDDYVSTAVVVDAAESIAVDAQLTQKLD